MSLPTSDILDFPPPFGFLPSDLWGCTSHQFPNIALKMTGHLNTPPGDEPGITLPVYFRILQHSLYRRWTITWMCHMSLMSPDLPWLIPTLSDQFQWRLRLAWSLSDFTTHYYFTTILLSPNLKAARLPQILSREILHFRAHWHTGTAKHRGRINKTASASHQHWLSGITVQSCDRQTILTW
jgi:hypothetical protein